MSRFVGVAVVVVSMLALSAVPALATPAASLSTTSGNPGTSLTVTGTGFAPNVSVDVFFDTTDVALAVSSASGAVSFAITVPTSAQPGKHWVTLDQLSNHTAAQASFTVSMIWPQGGWGPSWRGFNPVENTLDPSNVGQLTESWAQVVSPFANPKPFVDAGGNLFAFDENETLHAYSSAGKLLWTAAPGTTFRFSQAAPVATAGYVYVADSNGLVTGYPYQCRTDGGVCTTQRWKVNLGTAVNGGLTTRNGFLYAPGNDGVVHVINATTGALGTSITPFFSGAITQPVSFGPEGSAYIVQSNSVSQIAADGSGGGSGFGSGINLSPVAVGNGIGYVTDTEGKLDQVPGGWTTAMGSAGCDVAPAFAEGVVYGASCNSIGAYDAGSGEPRWSISVPSQPQGLSVANGVLYACWGYRVRMYYASYGGYLGSGAPCAVAPEIVQGTVYTTLNNLTASTLGGAVATSVHGARTARRPDPRLLRADPRLRRHRRSPGRAGHRRHRHRASHVAG